MTDNKRQKAAYEAMSCITKARPEGGAKRTPVTLDCASLLCVDGLIPLKLEKTVRSRNTSL